MPAPGKVVRAVLLTLICSVLLAQQDAPRITYYLVEGIAALPGGQRVGTSVSLVKRTVDPQKRLIEERLISLRGSQPAQEIVTVVKPTGSKVTLSSAEGGFEGDGELTGEPWQWTGMKFTARLTEPKQTVEGEDRYFKTGMSAEKRMLGPDGKARVVIHETGSVIAEATYTALRQRLLPK